MNFVLIFGFSFFRFSKKLSLFNLQFLHEIKVKFIDFWFCGFIFKSSFIKFHFSQFLSPISSSDLIKFEEIIRIFPNSQWIRLLFTIIPFNSWIILKIGKFELYFDPWPCAFNDHLVSSHQHPTQGMNIKEKKLSRNYVLYMKNEWSVPLSSWLANIRSTQWNVKNPNFFFQNLNQILWICRSWNDSHVHKISFYNSVEIMRYHNLNFEHF